MQSASVSATAALDSEQIDLWMANLDAGKRHEQIGSSTDSVSNLDLGAPRQARREYDKGLQLLLQLHLKDAVEHLGKSVSLYPKFVAAHTALGSAYLDLGQNDRALEEFKQAVFLDDHLPNSHLNLGRAEMALKNYPAAEEAIRKAAAIAPLDLHLQTTLAYAQLLSRDYLAAIETVHEVHGRKHEGAAIVHYFGAVAWQAQNNPQASNRELQTLLEEDPNSPAAELARRMIGYSDEIEKLTPVPPYGVSPGITTIAPGNSAAHISSGLWDLQQPFTEATSESICVNCEAHDSSRVITTNIPRIKSTHPENADQDNDGWILHSAVDEVALFFAATDQTGKSVSDLAQSDINIRDNRNSPAAIVGFRRESELPLRLGLVIDTSGSIKDRFSFEQDAAASFAGQVLTDKDDVAFVVSFANSVLLIQDFTAEQRQISSHIGELAPAGGTAVWDAVAFAADKLANRQESQPVARILVVIGDGEDNCSKVSLQNAIRRAEHGDVIVYTVSTREDSREVTTPSAGDHALKLLAERTGGAAFFPGSLEHLKLSLTQLQQLIRSRYLISYKPALFKRDGHYRTIDISAQKSGHKLRVYARKGYYAPHDTVGKED